MAWRIIRRPMQLALPMYEATVEIHFDPEQHALLAVDTETGEAEVLSLRLPDFPLPPDQIIVKDWSEHFGVAEALAAAGIIEIVGQVSVGPFESTAYVARVLVEQQAAA
jgi:hypothetical protein